MKKNISTQIIGRFLFQICKKKLSTQCRKDILDEYQQIIDNAKDIGKHNTLISSYILGAWFIAMNRKDSLSPDENFSLLSEQLHNNWIFKLFMGDADHYLNSKRIEKQKNGLKAHNTVNTKMIG